MYINDIILMIISTISATALVIVLTSLIKLVLFRLFKLLPTKQMFREYVLMHLLITILITLLVLILNNYSISGIFRVVAPIFIVFSIFEAFYIYDKHLTYEPMNQYTFSMIISSIINMFLVSFLVYQAIEIILY